MKKGTKALLSVILSLLVIYTVLICIFVDTERQNLLTSLPLIILSIAFAFIHGYSMYIKKSRKEIYNLKKQLLVKDELSKSIRKHNEVCLTSLPVGIIMYDNEYDITYANKFASTIFKMNELIGKPIESLKHDLYHNLTNRTSYDVDIFNKHIIININADSKVIYLFDSTISKESKDLYNLSRPSIMILSIDNIEILDNYDLQEKTDILSKYYQVIESWKDKFNLYQVSNDSDRIIYIFDVKTLEQIKKDGFTILKNIDDLSNLYKKQISISIGVGTKSDDYNCLGLYSEKALELASDRGGAQAIIYDGTTFKSYQGLGEFSEKRNRVETKTFGNNLINLIKESSCVLIEPHIDTDADAFSSSYALYLLCNHLNTPAKILLDPDRIDTTVKRIITQSQSEYISLSDAIINLKDAKSFLSGKPLLILTDHHEKKLSISESIIDQVSSIALIDHHRLTEALEFKPIIDLIDYNASSTVELVTEILDVLSLDLNIPSFISTIMYVGMIIDTNDFRAHVSENTFNAAAYLMKHSASSSKAKLYLRESIEEKEKRTNILKSAEIINKHYALVKFKDQKVLKEDLAKAAEALLDTEGIIAAFALGYLDRNTVGISARSSSNFNVHREMERLGGGGHFNMGAAQIENISLDDVYQMTLTNLLATIEGGVTSMKVILIEDVKNKGKKGDIIEVNPGYGNFLLTKKFAIEANDDNLAALSIAKQNKAKQDQEELDVAKKTKELIENTKITIKVKLGDNGKFFGSISNKSISEELLKETKIDVDKRKIQINDKIDSIGTYECQIKLHKDVTATLKFDVCEE